jgi:hypothetical protein
MKPKKSTKSAYIDAVRGLDAALSPKVKDFLMAGAKDHKPMDKWAPSHVVEETHGVLDQCSFTVISDAPNLTKAVKEYDESHKIVVNRRLLHQLLDLLESANDASELDRETIRITVIDKDQPLRVDFVFDGTPLYLFLAPRIEEE